MPLGFFPDRFGETKHAELDKAVNKAVRNFDQLSNDNLLDALHLILSCVVDNSDGELDSKYTIPHEAKGLIEAHDELRDLLLSAWKPEHKSYSKIRNLKILASPQALYELSAPAVESVHQMLSRTFKGEYRGVAVEAFYEYLTVNEELFRKGGYYAKLCSVVQSSGTGKSRMLSELPKMDVITIYMCLRPEDDKLSFPPRDRIASEILMSNRNNDILYTTSCYAFFIALFQTVDDCLSKIYSTPGAKAIVTHWARQMCNMSDPPESMARTDFFRRLNSNHKKVKREFLRIMDEQRNSLYDSWDFEDLDTDVMNVARLFISKYKEPLIPCPDLGKLFQDSFLKMATTLDRIFPDHGTKPKMVIAIDEAHTLTAPLPRGDYRPADTFCRVVNEWSHLDERQHAVWVVFASTTSKAADFSPPNKIRAKLFPLYTQLGWDQSASPLASQTDAEDISRFQHIAAFGRPLWLSLKGVVWTPGTLLNTASEKLCAKIVYKSHDSHQVIAVLGQRFAVDIAFGHPDSVEHMETGVASHLRVGLDTTPSRAWRFTSYPSEPLLSCAAAKILHGTAGSLRGSLNTLLELINDGMIDMGERGELAGRLLWLLAKDLFIRTRKDRLTLVPSSWDGHLADCEMIPVVDWFEFVFGPQIWNLNDQASVARKAFEDAYLNFSHWICMVENIRSGYGPELPLEQFTLRLWQRTSAVQCCDQQPLIDKVIPIYFKDKDKPAEETMSQILISDKAQEFATPKDVLQKITRGHEAIGGERSVSNSKSPPYIAILADLSQTPSLSVTFPEEEINDRCLRIYAAGVDTSIYPFLSGCPALMKTLQELVLREKMSVRKYSTNLDAQVMFGSTMNAVHMEWECPPSEFSE